MEEIPPTDRPESPRLALSVVETPCARVLTGMGELMQVVEAQEFQTALLALIDAPDDGRRIAADLRTISFIDSAGLATLVHGTRRLHNAGRTALTVATTPQSQPHRVLRMIRGDIILRLVEDPEA